MLKKSSVFGRLALFMAIVGCEDITIVGVDVEHSTGIEVFEQPEKE